MSGCKTDIDWAQRPEPWRRIGPQFRRSCDMIAAGLPTLPRITDAEQIERRRAALGITARQLGQIARVTENQVWNAEGDRASGRIVSIILKALGDIEREAR